MKFSNAITLCLASGAWASPAPKVESVPTFDLAVRADNFDLETRADSTLVGTIDASLNALVPVLGQYEAAITTAVNTIKSSSSAQLGVILQAVVGVNTNIGAIVAALSNATSAITGATTAAAGGVVGAAQALTAADLALLEKDLATLQNIVNGLGATITATTGVSGAAKLLIAGEVAALEAALQPFINPVLIFAQAATKVGLGVSVTGIQNALAGVQSIVSSLYTSLGLGNLTTIISSALGNLGL